MIILVLSPTHRMLCPFVLCSQQGQGDKVGRSVVECKSGKPRLRITGISLRLPSQQASNWAKGSKTALNQCAETCRDVSSGLYQERQELVQAGGVFPMLLAV